MKAWPTLPVAPVTRIFIYQEFWLLVPALAARVETKVPETLRSTEKKEAWAGWGGNSKAGTKDVTASPENLGG